MTNGLISHEKLKRLLTYYPQSGDLIWEVTRARSASDGQQAGCVNKTTGYLVVSVDRRQYAAARLAWFWVHGRWPVGFIDHINGDPLDNRICNLRECSREQNNSNRKIRKDNRSGIKGIVRRKIDGRWIARIGVNGAKMYLGIFNTAAEAKAIYDAAAVRYHGEFARLT